MLLPLAHLAQQQQLMLGVGLTATKTALADLACQRLAEQKSWPEIDTRRTAIFALYGLLYLGFVQYGIYSILFPKLFPLAHSFAALPLAEKLVDRAGQRTVLMQVILDQGIHWPIFAIPAFHIFKGMGEERGPISSLRSCRAVWLSDIKACWAIWVPACLLNFSLMPIELRVHFAAFVSFGYTCLVSWRRGTPLPAEACAPKQTA